LRYNNLTKIDFEDEYRTGSVHEPLELMKLGLSQAILYRRASGYFSSSIFELFDKETLEFAKSGGVINLMCSPVLSRKDLDQISLGYELKSLITKQLFKEVSELAVGTENDAEMSFLATLIHHSVLDIKLLFRDDGAGIFHEKSGYFKDNENNILSFSGSANESRNAFSGGGNFERIKVFPSWKQGDLERCKSDCKFVDDLWGGNVNGLGVYDFPDVAKKFLERFTRDNLDELDQVFSPEAKPKNNFKKLMAHQSLALENWEKSGKQGIFKHATGSGKTVTAIGAIKQHMKTGNPTLVLVPSKLLLMQWYTELKQEIGDVLILRCGAGHTYWKQSSNLKQMFQNISGGDTGGIVLAVNDTASSADFIGQLINQKNTLIVADEVHALGSAKNSQIMNNSFAFRLGLSATPERYRDPEGTEKLFNFFGGVVLPEVTLGDALKSGRLVPYDYYPILTYLNAEEEADWVSLTNKIVNYLRSQDLDVKGAIADKVLSQMLINRSRIAKKARSKVDVVVETLTKSYKDGEHWLVYCEDGAQLYEISERLVSKNINPFIYVSDMEGSPAGELEAFSAQSGVLLSIRCLDEGVDIPKISHAIIVASSQNPRQFIQRRGRVLRKSPGKLNAVIYDCIVAPSDLSQGTKFDGLILSEANRSIEFARTARNANSAESTLRNILINIGSDPDEIMLNIDGDEEND
jgi:superfamily II DNA or RNA helicase